MDKTNTNLIGKDAELTTSYTALLDWISGFVFFVLYIPMVIVFVSLSLIEYIWNCGCCKQLCCTCWDDCCSDKTKEFCNDCCCECCCKWEDEFYGTDLSRNLDDVNFEEYYPDQFKTKLI